MVIQPRLGSEKRCQCLRQTLLLGGGGSCCLSLFAAPPPLPCTSPLGADPPLLLGFAPALSDLALLPLDGFGAGAASELRLQLDHAGADGVTFAAGLVALGPLGPLGDHAVDRWRGGEERSGEEKRVALLTGDKEAGDGPGS